MNPTPLDLATRYLEIFYSGKNLETLSDILSENFKFEGPLFQCDSREAYIESLKSEPPIDFTYSVKHSFENESSACIIYQFSKANISTPMAQHFKVVDGKISHILLIFDTREFEN